MCKSLLASAILLAFVGSVSASTMTNKTLDADWTETLTKPLENTVVEAGNFAIDLKMVEKLNGLIKNATINSTNDVTLTGNDAVLYTSKTDIHGDLVTIRSTAKKGTAIASYGSHTIKANNILLEAEGDVIQGSGDMDGDISLTATDTITVRSTGTDGEAIQGFKGNFTLKANKVVLESVGGQAVAQRDTGSTIIEADDVIINAYQGGRVDDKLLAVRVNNGTLTFNVKNSLKITDNGADETSALGVDGDNGKLIIQAKEAVIDGNIDAAKGEVQLDGELVFEGQQATISKLTGSKATFTITDANQTVAIDNNNRNLTLAATGNVNDAVGIDALKNIELTGTIEGVQLVAEEGMFSQAITATYNSSGELTDVVTKTNSVMSNVLDMASATSLSLNRILMNDVRKRMGDLRASETSHGAWVRYDGGRLSGSNNLENDFNTVQMGIDTIPTANAARMGVAFSYTKGDTEMKRGDAEMDTFGLAFYGTKVYDNGIFVDVIGRMASASTDMTIDTNKKGTLDNIAMSLSGEMGWRYHVTNQFYIEPQAELTYTYINADTMMLNDGSTYKFDSTDSLIGRVGFASGFNNPTNKGSIYIRASAVHEFLGDATVRGGQYVHGIDGEDTWVEFGLGGQWNINKATYVWADVERTDGATLEEDWRATLGIRYNF